MVAHYEKLSLPTTTFVMNMALAADMALNLQHSLTLLLINHGFHAKRDIWIRNNY